MARSTCAIVCALFLPALLWAAPPQERENPRSHYQHDVDAEDDDAPA